MNLDPYDAKRDADSEARYEDDPQAEPMQGELDELRYGKERGYILDDHAGFRG